MWTTSQISQAMKPAVLIGPTSATAAFRPMVASEPLSTYRKGRGGSPRSLRSMERPARLDAGRRHARYRLAVLLLDRGKVADDEHLLSSWHRQVVLDDHAPGAI